MSDAPAPIDANKPAAEPRKTFAAWKWVRRVGCALNREASRKQIPISSNSYQFSHQPLSQQDVTFSGCHRAWLEQRKRYLPAWKRLTPLLNLMHPITLGLESRALSPERTGLVIAHSEFVKREIIRQYGFPAERIRVVHNGINWQRFSTIARSSRIGERFVLLYAVKGSVLTFDTIRMSFNFERAFTILAARP